MICKNCGTPNKVGIKACVSCNFPIETATFSPQGHEASPAPSSSIERAAIRENKSGSPKNSVACPQCKYEIIKESDTCPMCAFSFSRREMPIIPEFGLQPKQNGSVANQPLQRYGAPSFEDYSTSSKVHKELESERSHQNGMDKGNEPSTGSIAEFDREDAGVTPSRSAELEKVFTKGVEQPSFLEKSVKTGADQIKLAQPNTKADAKDPLKQTQEPFVVSHPDRALMFGTIDPFRKEEEVVSKIAYLTPVMREGEPVAEAIPITAPDHKVKVNRTVLEPENNTITSKVQAIFECINGIWYLVDQSEQQTTFVLANQPTALKKGDIILMGNRKFIFEC